MTKTEKAIQWMEKTASDNRHGYDQRYRWGEKGDYDCSSAVITAWENSGVPVKTKGATYTGNMLNVFKSCGFKDVTRKVNRVTGTGMKRGDVLLNVRNHVSMFCGNYRLVQASINEHGGVVNGTPGDQTGKEFYIRSYYNYPWDYVLRYNESVPRGTSKKVTIPNGTPKKVVMTGTVTADVLNVRKWAGTENAKLSSRPTITQGTPVGVCGKVKDKKNHYWYYILIDKKIYGFVDSDYIKL